jgi:hypothetical protein
LGIQTLLGPLSLLVDEETEEEDDENLLHLEKKGKGEVTEMEISNGNTSYMRDRTE